MPDLAGVTSPVTVQLRGPTGICWEAVYSAPFDRQTADTLVDKAD